MNTATTATEPTKTTDETKKADAPKKAEAKKGATDAAKKAQASRYNDNFDLSTAPRVLPLKRIKLPDWDARSSGAEPKPLDAGFLQSLRENKIIQPLVVRPLATEGDFEVVAGRRRRRGAEEVGLTEAPVVVRTYAAEAETGFTPSQIARREAIAENEQREQMTAWDRYTQICELLDEGLTQTQIAKLMNRTGGSISQHMAIGKLCDEAKEIIRTRVTAGDDKIIGKVIELNRLSDYPEDQAHLAKLTFDRKAPLSGSDVKDYVDAFLAKKKREAEVAKQREKARKERAKAKEAGEEGEETAEEEPVDPYAAAEIAVPKKDTVRSLLTWLATKSEKAQSLPEDAKDREKKIAFEKGRLEGALMVAGLGKLPPSVANPAEK